MLVCGNCGGENAELARFCQFCGTALGDRTPVDQRKIVTVVFSDMTGSTEMGERLDAEKLRSVMTRYYEAMRTVIERHGGTVEKFIGDAVMAVFGIPQVHEDDALRAVRAAAEMLDRLAELNAHFEAEGGVQIRTRTGVHTGEVMAGDSASAEGFVVGDTVNVAARLEQAAQPGEILLGSTTAALVRDAVRVEAIAPLDLKGKAEPVPAFRLLEVRPDTAGRERHLDAPIVGRERQLRSLRDALEAATTDRTCVLFTVLGSPGVGKTRLVTEFLTGAEGVAVHRGRCLSYGEGITFWPIDEIVRSIAGVPELQAVQDVRAAIRAVLEGAEEPDAIEARLAGLLGLSTEPVAREDGFWAVRRLLEHAAEAAPLVLLLDDIHWAEPTLLDLIEHLTDWSRGAPILVLCTARPELLETRPNWGGGKPNASSTLLEPLTADESEHLVANLVGAGLPAAALQRIAAAAEGNPLFVEEMVGMLIDEGRLVAGDEGWAFHGELDDASVPASIQTLITARLDRLGREERTVVERGSVEGSLFHVGSVAALAPDVDGVPGRLMSLVRKEFIRPDRADFAGEDAFRFRHVLIRDSAYESMPKRTRADLHERFADWLVTRAADAGGGLDAIVAHHLDQAHRYLTELGGEDARRTELAALAGARFLIAGGAAFARSDATAAVTLLDRAVDLLPTGGADAIAARIELGRSLVMAGGFQRADRELALAAREATDGGHEHAALEAAVVRMELTDHVSTDLLREDFLRQSRTLRDAMLEHGDLAGAARAILATANWLERTEGIEAAHEATELARAAGDVDLEREARSSEVAFAYWGPTPATEVERLARELLDMPNRARMYEALTTGVLGGALGMLGRIDEGREAIERSQAIGRSLGDHGQLPGVFAGGNLELFAGDLEAADRSLRAGYEKLRAFGEKNRFSTLAAQLGRIAVMRGDVEAAEGYLAEALEAATPSDEDTHSIVAGTRSLLASLAGDPDTAVAEAERAVEMLEGRGSTWSQAILLQTLGEARLARGDTEGGRAALTRALELFDAKELLPLAAQVRRRLEDLAT
jgi:class 3 adenylate cyclase/tetratricopeptide (TPR) repeat protein